MKRKRKPTGIYKNLISVRSQAVWQQAFNLYIVGSTLTGRMLYRVHNTI